MKRSAGILIPLFSLNTRDDLGSGEILDLKEMIDFALAMGHRMILLLPLDERAPGERSPYSALSVFAIDPAYISALMLRGVGPLARMHARHEARSAAGTDIRLREAKRKLLDKAFEAGRREHRREFEEFAGRNAYWLRDYALFRALKDRYRWASWEEWPAEIARREPDALEAARGELELDAERHSYWQFIANQQFLMTRAYAASHGAMLGGDLAFSPSRESAEVWANQHIFDLSRTIGTPPDAFTEKGQRWGLPMPRWDVMRADGFAFLRGRIRRAAALYDFIRIDHVVGLYRTFVFGADPEAPGSFVPAHEDQQRDLGESTMRAILEEAGKGRVIAEDLGTVPPWVRQSLTALGVPGYTVMQWERENWHAPQEKFLSPSSYPELSLATTGTHDTETLIEWWDRQPEEERRRLADALGIDGRAPADAPLNRPTLDAILESLYAAPSRMVVLPIQDLFGWRDRINLPGTVGDLNWTYRLPKPISKLRREPLIQSRIEELREIAQRTGRFG
ncbi:MAG TPA: 4-alpha-glucanotransferase [Candidatus Binataceae bacterium]